MTHKIATVVGARPQFIKAAPMSKAIAAQSGLAETLIHTGQHYDQNMSDIFFSELMPKAPKYLLKCGGLPPSQMIGQMIEGLANHFEEIKPDLVLIYGDTNSTLAGAIAASKMSLPVAHVEAGVRSGNRYQTEEINRIIADNISSLLFCPTPGALRNLENEGLGKGAHFCGDVMYDLALLTREKSKADLQALLPPDVQKTITENNQSGYGVCTLHRAENLTDRALFKSLIDFISEQATHFPIFFVAHPRTRALMEETGLKPKGVTLLEPLGYGAMQALIQPAKLLLTDSGGLQKEAYFHKVRAIVLRDETEWPELIKAGWTRLWTTEDWACQPHAIDVFGEGNASKLISAQIRTFLN